MQPITMEEAADLGVPECFSAEYAFLEHTGQLPPYSGPVEPDWGSDAYDLYDDERYGEPSDFPPAPVDEPSDFPPAPVVEPEELKVMPTGRPGHKPWCDVDHDAIREHCPPPF
jgi:hypothetical protein